MSDIAALIDAAKEIVTKTAWGVATADKYNHRVEYADEELYHLASEYLKRLLIANMPKEPT
jgi:hypothetical protein